MDPCEDKEFLSRKWKWLKNQNEAEKVSILKYVVKVATNLQEA